MFFDDRLATVLRQRATGEASQRTQYRQLLDLLGRERGVRDGSDRSLLATAWLRLDALAGVIPAAVRAGMIREPGWRFRSPDLVVHLADQEPEVAAAALTRADLEAGDWTALIPRLPVRARGFLRLRRDLPVDVEALLEQLGVHDRGLPAPAHDAAPPAGDLPADIPPAMPPQFAKPQAPPPPGPAMLRPAAADFAAAPPPVAPPHVTAPPVTARSRDETGRTEISALVERIAQFRRTRSESQAELERSPRLPLGEWPERAERLLAGFGFATDTTGRIAWAVAEAAPMVIGMRLFAGSPAPGGAASELARAFQRRQPITRAALGLDGAPAITGDWIVDAEPRFSEEGHFTGYFGRLRRVPDAAVADAAGPEAREADRIRQLLHELRTPVTAVQGYAEVIQQQLFGPAPHEYRALAAAIAADAARILAGFEELDRLARLETGAVRIEPGECDLAALLHRTAAQLAPVLAPQEAGFDLGFAADTCCIAAIDPEDAEALVWRLMASLAAAAAPAERIGLRLDPVIGAGRGEVRLRCALPARLAASEGASLFAATTRTGESAISPGLFGTGFALRLARAEAQGAGGALRRDGDALLLTLPLLGGNRELRDAIGA
ncbi:histidine kinase dimerization/phospho-acceptor domain-containing protein [Porphyrobacter sp. AAP82]|uniref:histidine kinase dimerization/phospho-acceptor domain-containing protein n=1 Tax=Porphyrobacter sp. AAP82 TaxID=1248917 RepID=UPI0002DAEC6C|nr:histidine kinase dimerization/phospho-acceptor domain-containing protein [Porphyrobacter sp. AAP82]